MAKKASSKSKSAIATPESGVATVEPAPKKAARGKAPRRTATTAYTPGAGKDRHLVIVESPSKAKTINKYLGKDYLVLASVGHVRDLPEKNPKGVKSPVPGVDLEKDFNPTYVISDGKDRVISDLKRAAKEAIGSGHEVWFATDLDREGEAIAWHLAQELGIKSDVAKRVVFPAITKSEIEKAFNNPHPINEDRVNAQQARRILDRIVGYQVSPLLWKKVARGLSAGRVQSVATRLVVEREREIRAFIPDEYWAISGCFTAALAQAAGLSQQWLKYLATSIPRPDAARKADKNAGPTLRMQGAWLAEHDGFRAELVELGGKKIDVIEGTALKGDTLAKRARELAELAGIRNIRVDETNDPDGKGPATTLRRITGEVDTATPYKVSSIETRRTSTRPTPPFITSSMQAAAASRLGFAAQRTMRTAQQLYEGVEIPGEGPVGLITYMRTDSTHLSKDAIEMVRSFVKRQYGERYLPENPNFYTSSNKDAQEAHEAIRPTNVDYTPRKVAGALSPDQLKLYTLIWERFVACQMMPAQWDSTAFMITGGKDPARQCTFRATGRVLVFDGFYKATGVPQSADEQNLPPMKEGTPLAPFALDAAQKFTSPPPRYSEASLIKMLEAEGIGRPSTYASIISVIQDRKYVEKLEGRFAATDLGEVVTDKLIEAFPEILNVGYTREMESQLDKVEDDHIDWVEMLHGFYKPFKKALSAAETDLKHAKAETVPAPDKYKCPNCGSGLVYRFGRNGRFLSCSTYSTDSACKYASPCDRDGVPRPAAETVDVACAKCKAGMTKRVGRFGPFLGCSRYGEKVNPCDGLLNLDKKGRVEAPSMPPLVTELLCDKCQRPLNLRNGVRGLWLGCSGFPKCRGRGQWNELEATVRDAIQAKFDAHEKANPIPIIKNMKGEPLTDAAGKPLPNAMPVGTTDAGEPATLEAAADAMGL
jgi:DNA topoisomerase-1